MDVYPLDQHARNLRSLLHPVAMPQDYHEAKRISLQRDEQRLAMSELTLDQSRLDIHMQLMLVRANSLEAIAERATDLQIRISCRERAAEIRQMLEGFEPIVRSSKRHLQELSEVMDL